MAFWKVEIASEPGIHAPGVLDQTLTLVGAAVEDAVEEKKLVSGDGSGSADGRIGGVWIIECGSAAQAAVLASELLIMILSAAERPFTDCVVDVLHVDRASADDLRDAGIADQADD